MGRHVYLAAIVLLAHFSSRGGETYFGGHGDTNSHWVGYELKVSRGAMKWKAYTLAAEQRGKIKEAGATFFQEGTNSWSGIFEEIEVGSTGSNVVYDVTYGLSHHTLHVVKSDQREFI